MIFLDLLKSINFWTFGSVTQKANKPSANLMERPKRPIWFKSAEMNMLIHHLSEIHEKMQQLLITWTIHGLPSLEVVIAFAQMANHAIGIAVGIQYMVRHPKLNIFTIQAGSCCPHFVFFSPGSLSSGWRQKFWPWFVNRGIVRLSMNCTWTKWCTKDSTQCMHVRCLSRMSHSTLAMQWENVASIRDKARKLELATCHNGFEL